MLLNRIFLLLIFIILPLTYGLGISDYFVAATSLILILAYFGTKRTISLSRFFSRRHNSYSINTAFLIYIIYLLLCLLNGLNMIALLRIVQIIICYFSFMLGSQIAWDKDDISFIKNIIKVVLAVIFVHWIINETVLNNYSFIYGNPNSFASILLVWSFLLCIGFDWKKRTDILSMILLIIIIFATASRASLISIILNVLLIQMFRGKTKAKKFLFYATIIGMAIFIYVYVELLGTEIGIKLQTLSNVYFNKNFFSGRQIAWESMLEQIAKKPLIGYGLGVLPSDLTTEFTYSGHNLFLQTILQCGFIGLLLLLSILKEVYFACIENKKSRYALYAGAIVISIIIHENFEITLTQNMIVCGMQTWMIFGLGCNLNSRLNYHEA